MIQQQVHPAQTPVAAVSLDGVVRHLFPGQQLRIGRDRGCDLVTADPEVSRIHAAIQADAAGVVFLQDLGSVNGTFAGAERVTACRVTNDYTFMLGTVQGTPLQVTLRTSPPPRPVTSPGIPEANAGPAPHPLPTQFTGPAATGQLAGVPTRPVDNSRPTAPPVHRPAGAPPAQPWAPPAVAAPELPHGETIWVSQNKLAQGGEVSIGRAPTNTIVLDDPLVSRQHARLQPNPDGSFGIIDLGSLNGLQLNGYPVGTNALFRPGDRLSIGRTTLQIINGQIVSDLDQPGAALIVNSVSFKLKSGRELLSNVSFGVAPGSLIGVVGPSGAGKSTLLKAITGSQPATSGEVIYQGHDLYRNFANLRQLIGVVPQDDVVHRQLTVRAALGYAAELRLPSDYDKAARDREVARVINDLGLTNHQDTLISRLSGGQRKRTSVAMELLTQPQLLLLDEPTSGLDPGLDLDVMKLLRAQADGGRTVLVVTHSTDNLELCDQVLILAPGGFVAYYGSPDKVLGYFRRERYAEVFKGLSDDPRLHAQRWAHDNTVPLPPPVAAPPNVQANAPKQRGLRQWNTLIRRQLRIIASDRSYALATLLLPLVIAGMSLVIPGEKGFGTPDLDQMGEPSQLLVIITVGAAFMGMSASIRELIAERPIFLRERTVGLSPLIYLLAKVCVLFAMTLVQSALLISVVRLGKPGPETAIWASDGSWELWLAAFGTSFASALLGLLMSSLVGTSEQTMPVLVITIMAQLVFCGGLITITDRGALEWLAAIFPSRWGFAMSASTIDLTNLNPAIVQDDVWEHSAEAWWLSFATLFVIGQISLVLTAIKLYRQPANT